MKMDATTIGVIVMKAPTISGELLSFYRMEKTPDRQMIVIPTTAAYYRRFLKIGEYGDIIKIKNCRV